MQMDPVTGHAFVFGCVCVVKCVLVFTLMTSLECLEYRL